MTEGSVEADALCLGRETTFGTQASWGTGSAVLNSFSPGLKAVPKCKGEGSISRHTEVLLMEGCKTSPEFSQENSVTVHKGDQT